MVCNTVLPFFDIETETPPEGEFPIKMKDSNVPMAYKDICSHAVIGRAGCALAFNFIASQVISYDQGVPGSGFDPRAGLFCQGRCGQDAHDHGQCQQQRRQPFQTIHYNNLLSASVPMWIRLGL